MYIFIYNTLLSYVTAYFCFSYHYIVDIQYMNIKNNTDWTFQLTAAQICCGAVFLWLFTAARFNWFVKQRGEKICHITCLALATISHSWCMELLTCSDWWLRSVMARGIKTAHSTSPLPHEMILEYAPRHYNFHVRHFYSSYHSWDNEATAFQWYCRCVNGLLCFVRVSWRKKWLHSLTIEPLMEPYCMLSTSFEKGFKVFSNIQ